LSPLRLSRFHTVCSGYEYVMHTAPDSLFKTLADPTRRAIFERLIRDGEQTVGVLTDHSGVSQLRCQST
jgi:hypothetical protein